MVLLVSWPGWLETAELKLYDWRMRTVADIRIARKMPLVNPDIVLVEITDAAIRDLSELVGRWPWPRTVHGTLIDYISSGKPKAIAVDLTLLEQERESTYKFGDGQMTSVESDKALADSVKNAGNVIMLADAVDAGIDNGDTPEQKPWPAPPYRLGPAIEERPIITLPYPALAASAGVLAQNFVVIDPDGPVRRFPPFVRKGDRYMPFLGVAAALVGGGYRAEEVELEGDAIRIRDRLIPLVPVTVRDVKDPIEDASAVDDADQLPRAGSHRQQAAVSGLRRVERAQVIRPDGRGRHSGYPGQRVCWKDRSSSASTCPGWLTCSRHRWAADRCRAFNCTPALPTAFCRIASSVRHRTGPPWSRRWRLRSRSG